jgi:hypothetical protein
MVKMLLACLVPLLSLHCASIKTSIKENCSVLISAKKQVYSMNEDLSLSIKNENPFDIDVSRPDCVANLTLTLLNMSGEPVRKRSKIRVNGSCQNEFIHLVAGEEKTFIYPYKIPELFLIEGASTYMLQLNYNGSQRHGDEVARCSVTSTKSFSIE